MDFTATVSKKTEDEVSSVFTLITGRAADVLDLLASVKDMNSASFIPLFRM